MTLDFFKAKFGYEIEGVWFPRVTSITRPDSISKWWPGMQQAASWGVSIHEAIEAFLKGESLQADSRFALSIQTFQEWQRQYPLRIRNPEQDIETRVVDVEHGYAGTIDMVAEVDGVFGVVDLKTSTAILREHAVQTAAYLNAYNSTKVEKERCCARWILRIDEYQECRGCLARRREKYGRARIGGGNKFCNHQWSELQGEVEFRELQGYEKDLEAFFALKERWEWMHKEWLKKIPNYEKNIRQHVLV